MKVVWRIAKDLFWLLKLNIILKASSWFLFSSFDNSLGQKLIFRTKFETSTSTNAKLYFVRQCFFQNQSIKISWINCLPLSTTLSSDLAPFSSFLNLKAKQFIFIWLAFSLPGNTNYFFSFKKCFRLHLKLTSLHTVNLNCLKNKYSWNFFTMFIFVFSDPLFDCMSHQSIIKNAKKTE